MILLILIAIRMMKLPAFDSPLGHLLAVTGIALCLVVLLIVVANFSPAPVDLY
jgi:hypothetical protein